MKPHRRRDENGSMPIAMLITLVGVGLAGLLTNMVVARISDTRSNAHQVRALHAAQAGLDVGLGQARGAVRTNSATGAEEGSRAQLFCTPMTGTVGAGSDSAYRVSVSYYHTDPQGKPAEWLAANAISCPSGSGPRYVPAYARFTAVGTAGSNGQTATRTLSGTYVLHTTNANIYGGLIHARGMAGDFCVDAGSGDPAVGGVVTVQPCRLGAVSQTWAYGADLQIILVSSQRRTRPLGLCLQAGTTHEEGNPVTLEPCQTTGLSLWRQQWSLNDYGQFVGTELSTGKDVDKSCLRRLANRNLDLSMANCSSNKYEELKWVPDSAVGAGKAGSAASRIVGPSVTVGQLVNYSQFGRCVDVTQKNQDYGYLIAWPCKQNPSLANVLWNQKFALPTLPADLDPKKDGTVSNYSSGIIYTDKDKPSSTNSVTGRFCLESPLNPSPGQYVQTKSCTGAASQKWTVYGHTDQYATSYQIVDSTKWYCLQPSPTDTDKGSIEVSRLYVAPCDGSTLQKWNADKNVIEALALKDIAEG